MYKWMDKRMDEWMVELMDKWMAFNAKNTNCLKWGLYINSYSSQINWCCFFSVSFKKTNWLMSVFKCYWENAKRSWWSWGNFIFDFILFIQFVVTIIFFLSKNHSLWFISQSYTPPHIELYVFLWLWLGIVQIYISFALLFFPALNA